MATSGTYSWNPALSNIGAYALGRCNVRRPEITIGHLTDVAMAANLVLSDFSVDQPNLWAVELNTFPLVQGTIAYTLPANVLMVLDVYLTVTPASNGTAYNRIIYGVSRSEYASYPRPLEQAPPTIYWQDRIVPIVLTLYPAPDGNASYVLNYYAVIQDQDAVLTASTQVDLPYRQMSVFADCLAAKLALTYAQDRYPLLNSVAEKSYARVRAGENEMVSLYIVPGIGPYSRI
jgi:hypothetical protein